MPEANRFEYRAPMGSQDTEASGTDGDEDDFARMVRLLEITEAAS